MDPYGNVSASALTVTGGLLVGKGILSVDGDLFKVILRFDEQK